MKITVSPKLEKFVTKKIATGQYANPDDVVNGALQVLREQERLTAEDIEQLREEVAVGVDQLNEGRIAHFTAEGVIAKGRRLLARRKKKQ